MSAKELPWNQLPVKEWLSHTGIRSVSSAARGLLVDIRCIMHSATPYGHLTLNGKPMPLKVLARNTGNDSRECKDYLAELLDAGVLVETGDGDAKVIVWPDMVAGRERSDKLSAAGKKGGNPKLGVNPDMPEPPDGGPAADKPRLKGGVNPRLKPDGSSGLRPGLKSEVKPEVKQGDKAIYKISDKKENNINLVHSDLRARTLQPDDRLAFAATGSIAYCEPWASTARAIGRNIDIDVLATSFRKWLSEKKIDLDSPGMLQRWATFVAKHQVKQAS